MEPFKLLSREINNDCPHLVQDAVFLVEAEYAYLYGIDDLADRLEVTKHHLIRIFTANTGISPGKYLCEIRIYHAKNMLQYHKNAPLEIIAGACGYSCANYFCKVFKKQTGLTPTEYAKTIPYDPDGDDTNLSLQKLFL